MNSLELKKVLEVLDLEILQWRGRQKEKTGTIDDFDVYFSTSGYTVVKGPAPLPVAEKIYEKYPGNPHQIRVEGGKKDWEPRTWEKGGAIWTYHIDTKEGVLILLTELQDYFKKEGEVSPVSKYEELLAQVNRNLVIENKLQITAKDCNH